MARNHYERFDVPRSPPHQLEIGDTGINLTGPEPPNQRRFCFVAFLLNGITLTAGITGIALPFWAYESTSDGIAVSKGLWAVCGSVENSGWSCVYFKEVPAWIALVRALEVIGIVLIAVAGICAILKHFILKQEPRGSPGKYKKLIPKVTTILNVIGGVLMFSGTVLFNFEISKASPLASLYFGFGMCLLMGILGVVTGILYVLADRRKEL